MKNTWLMVNAVFYDGQNAYVSKFIVKGDDYDPFITINPDSEARIEEYLSGNGELLKIDILYSVDFDNIIALKDADEPELQCAYQRFKEMYF